MGINAFTALGNTVTFTANTSAPTPVQAVSFTGGANQYRIINSSTSIVFLGYGTTSANATSNATVISGSQFTLPLLPSTDEILTFVPNAYFTGITSTGSGAVYITPGDGL
jgi:hypothetical protein